MSTEDNRNVQQFDLMRNEPVPGTPLTDGAFRQAFQQECQRLAEKMKREMLAKLTEATEPVRLTERQVVDIGAGRYRVSHIEWSPGYRLDYLGPNT